MLDLSFQDKPRRLNLSLEETPLSKIEGAQSLFDITKNIYEEKIKPAFNALIEKPKERFGAIKTSIEQKSFEPLIESFSKQVEDFNKQMSATEGQIDLALSFSPMGMSKVVGKGGKEVIKKVVEEIPKDVTQTQKTLQQVQPKKALDIPQKEIPTYTDSTIINEARKYKTAEEFVKAQGNMIGETQTALENRLSFLGDNVSKSKTWQEFQDNLFKLPKEERGAVFEDLVGVLESKGLKPTGTVGQQVKRFFDNQDKFPEIFVKPLQTKSQLTDIWNKAHSIKPKENQIGDLTKERGFLQSIRESPNVSQELKTSIENLPEATKQYGIVTDQSALSRAQNFIDSQGTDSALNFVLKSDVFDKELSTTGIELMRRYQVGGNIDMATEVAASLMEKGTRGGQFIQAFSILDKLSPEGVLLFATKRTGQKLSEDTARKLTTQAEKIQELPIGYEKIKETQKLNEIIVKEIPISKTKKFWDFLLELLNTPRTLMSTLDFSFGLRQGLVAAWGFPKEFGKAFKAQFKPFASERSYEELMDTVIKHPDFKLAEEAGVAFTDVNMKLSAREEAFMSSLAEKIPALGHLVRASNRTYTAMANKLRMDVFSSMIENAERAGVAIRDDAFALRKTAEMVNNMTGRGGFGTGAIGKALNGAKEVLNAFFFSPRLMASRINLLNPTTYIKTTPQVRKEALRSIFSMAAGTTTILGLASLLPGVKVSTDPRSADFGKIRYGNTRIDIMGGFQQYIRIASQIISGKYVSSSTGKVITLGEGYNPLTRKDILLRGVESKEAPVFSFISTLMQGQDFEGKKIDVPAEVGKRLVPMLTLDLVDIAKEDPKLLPLGVLGLFGIGIQNYQPPEAYIKLNEIENSQDPAASYDQLKIENPILAEKVKKAKREKSFNEFDWSLVTMGVENGARARFLAEHFKSLKTDEERAQLWDDLREKKIISDKIKDQLLLLLEQTKTP